MHRNAPWWESFFTGFWPRFEPDMREASEAEAEAEFVVGELNLTPGARLLDIPCGSGRVGLPLARRGCRVTGVDFSDPVLERARDKARAEAGAIGEAGGSIQFIAGDMRGYSNPGAFDAVTCLWGSFGYFSDAENAAFLRRAWENLAPGGGFVLDTPVLESFMERGVSGDKRHVSGEYQALERFSYNHVTQRFESVWTFSHGQEVQVKKASIRIYTFRELTTLLTETGFTALAAYRGPARQPFAPGGRLHLAARKP